jgi:hypothetical protein
MTIRIDGTNTTANPGITGADADTGLQFGTNEIELVTGGTNRATVESNGNLTIEDGNLVVASGHGIDFSATADASGMSNELLDDYEEGTWVPALNLSVPGTSSFTASNNNGGYYVKVGKRVWVTFNLSGAWSLGTGSGLFFVSGLPFTNQPNQTSAAPGNSAYGPILIVYSDGVTLPSGAQLAGGLVFPGQSDFRVYYRFNTPGSPTLSSSQVGTTINFHGSGSYEVS